MDPELSSYVAARIAAYDSECPANQQWLGPYVRKHQVLPLYSDWLETFGLMADGALRKFYADGEYAAYPELRVVEQYSQFIYSLICGAKRYPPLLALIPKRPDDAVSCECQAQEYFNVVCSMCGGTGWFPANYS